MAELDAKGVIEIEADLDALVKLSQAIDQGTKSTTDFEGALRKMQKSGQGLGRVTGDAAKGTNQASKSVATLATKTGEAEAALPRLRYALYDVSRTALVTSTAITGLGIATVAAFASMESSFTNVERTLDDVSSGKVQELRQELVGLTREIPMTFGNISEIATLGNQLGIASSDIAQFTETTAKFSAVTGLTAEASAQAFGSLGELLNVQAADYENLGSSIALVGRRSVATEQEIVAMTTRLAASASNAGFTAQQVIALSGAFASLRIAPERAQGVMEIYFKKLNTAISEGGPQLEAFARTAGVTTAEVENLVRTDPVAFFERLATGLGQMDQIAQTGALAELGLQGIRAGEVFGRVSANVEVFNKALGDANQGWSEGTELGSQYAKVVDDLASRWQIFLNAMQELGATVGGILAPAIGVALQMLTTMAQGFAAVNEATNGWLLGPTVIIAAIVAGLTGLVGISALALASMAAMKTAIAELGLTSGASAVGLRGLSVAASQVGTAMGFSAGAINTFKIALASTGIGLLVVALGTLAAGLMEMGDNANATSEEVKGLADSLAEAIGADTQAYLNGTGTAIATLEAGFTSAISVTDRAATSARDYAGVQGDAASSVDAATQKIQEQTRVLGENAEAFFRSQLAADQDFVELANDPALRAAAEQAGFTVGEMITQGIRNEGGFTAYIDELRAKGDQLMAAWQQQTTSGAATAETDRLYEQAQATIAAADALGGYATKMDDTRRVAEAAGVATEYAGASATDAAGGYDEMGESAAGASEKMWGIEQAALGVESKIYALGQTVGENSGAWDQYSEAGRDNLTALYSVLDAIAAETPGNTSAIASNFQALYDQLVSGGFASAEQLSFLQQKVIDLANTGLQAFGALRSAGSQIGGAIGNVMQVAGKLGQSAAKSVKPAKRDFTSLFNGIQAGADKAAKAVGGSGGNGGLTREIRTLVDYASDLSGVMKRAFDIRFGPQQGLDQITSGWQKIADAADKAREAAEEHARTLAEMGADRNIKQYWLQVAENYGDELRAAKLRAELAELDSKMAKEKKDLTKAQEQSSMSLSGNSAAAIANRAALLGLVGNYQDYLNALASSGASQATLQAESQRLRGEFVNQATQMGFNRGEVDLYATAFDDMTTSINGVPRNITVTANVNPALQALNELEAKARQTSQTLSNVGSGMGSSIGNNTNQLMYRVEYALAMAKSAGFALQAIFAGSPWMSIGYQASAAAWRGIANNYRAAGGFAAGGYTGGSSASEERGVVHGKEFVFSAAATKNIGVNNLAYAHNMAKSGKGFSPVGLGASGGGGPVDLSAASVNAIAGVILAANPSIVLPGAQLAGSVGAHNTLRSSIGAA